LLLSRVVKKLRAVWASLWEDVDRRVRLGRILGLVFIVAGFAVIGKAWDGAAGQNVIPAQIPYLLSGGFMGIALVVTGVTLLLLSTVRGERQILTEKFEEMATLLGRTLSRQQYSANGSVADKTQVIAGASVYHLAGCKVLDGKSGLTTITVEQALAEGLVPCRVCDPPGPEAEVDETAEASTNGAADSSETGDEEKKEEEPVAATSSATETPTP
jgi:hypothetical protein